MRNTHFKGVVAMKCPWCNVEFKPTRDWQKFCCKEHRIKFNSIRGYVLPPFLDKVLADVADGQKVSNLEMLCKILHQTLNPGQQTLSMEEIYGKPINHESPAQT